MVKSLILCEGEGDKTFFGLLCQHLNCNKQIEMIDFNGKPGFFKIENYKTIKQKVDTNQYAHVLFVVDADFIENDVRYGGFDNSERELKNMITTLGFEGKSSICIMCDPVKKTGNLEHLILSTVDDKKRGCIESFLNCIEAMDTCSNKKIILSSYKEIFKEAPYSFNHENFNEIKTKIKNIIGQEEGIV